MTSDSRGAYCAKCAMPRTFDMFGCMVCSGRACADCGMPSTILVTSSHPNGDLKFCRLCMWPNAKTAVRQ